MLYSTECAVVIVIGSQRRPLHYKESLSPARWFRRALSADQDPPHFTQQHKS